MGGPEKDQSCVEAVYFSFLMLSVDTLDGSSFFNPAVCAATPVTFANDVLLCSVPPKAKHSSDMYFWGSLLMFLLYSPSN